jgi:hypothetical protein
MDPFNKLAEKFNNYSLYDFQNLTILYVDGKPVVPYQARPMMTSIADNCWDLNPCFRVPIRPERNGEWIKKTWMEMRGTISKIKANYSKSGNQDGENRYDEWQKFSKTPYGDVYTYAMVVIPLGLLDELGKELPTNISRDTGPLIDAPTPRVYSNTLGARNKKRQRDNKKLMLSGKSSNHMSDDEDEDMNSLSKVLKIGLQAENKHKALQFLATHGTEDDRTTVLNQMRLIAGCFPDNLAPIETPRSLSSLPRLSFSRNKKGDKKIVDDESEESDVDEEVDDTEDEVAMVSTRRTRSSSPKDGLYCNECSEFIPFGTSQQSSEKRTNHMCLICNKGLHGICGTNDGQNEMNRICKGNCSKQYKKLHPNWKPIGE